MADSSEEEHHVSADDGKRKKKGHRDEQQQPLPVVEGVRRSSRKLLHPSGVFSGYQFFLSHSEKPICGNSSSSDTEFHEDYELPAYEKDRLKLQIEQNGGLVCDKISLEEVDPSIQRATAQPAASSTQEFNPFDQGNETKNVAPPNPVQPPSQPAVMQPSGPPPAYTAPPASAAAASGVDDFRRKQEELERKEAELNEREEQLRQNPNFNARANNWPPLPKICPVSPCFYQDFNVDIPVEFRKIVKIAYYLWIANSLVHIYNVIASIANMASGSDSAAFTTFGLSLLYLILFVPSSFVCWYRPVYKAFRSDSSFNFFMYFFVFFAQFIVHILESIGFWTCGFINGIAATSSAPAAGAMMIICGACFAALATIDFLVLIRIHRIYRYGAVSFNLASAQAEFATGVMSNETVRGAAQQAAYGAATGAVSGGGGKF